MFLRDDTYCFELLAASVRGERLKALDRPSAESEHRFFVLCADAQWSSLLVIGMPRPTVVLEWERRSIRARSSSAPTRLALSPSTSPSRPSLSASAIRSSRLARIATIRRRWSGPGRSRLHLRQLCSNAAGAAGPAAVAQSDSAAFEAAKELLPFLVCRGPAFLAWAAGATPGDERAVAADELLGTDRLVAHGGVDVSMADHELGDVGRHTVHDRSDELTYRSSSRRAFLARSRQRDSRAGSASLHVSIICRLEAAP